MRIVVRTPSGDRLELGVIGGRWVEPSRASGPSIDRSGGFAVSGLADAHAHLAQPALVLEPGDPDDIRRRASDLLLDGVMLCLDKGWRDRSVLTLAAVDEIRRPDLQAAGRMLAPAGGYYRGFGRVVEPDGLAEAVRAEAADPATWVKIVGDWPRKGLGAVANYGEEDLAAAVAAAHALGVRVAVHTMAPGVASMAVRAGVDSVEHGLFLTDDDLRALGSRGGAWVPTVVNVESIIRTLGPDSSGGRLLAEGLDRVRSLLPVAPGHGVRVLAGTDLAVPSGRVGTEAARLAGMGLPVPDAVAAATSAVYEVAGIEYGLRPGAPADLVVFDRNPREDPSALAGPTFVMRRGVVLVGG